MVKVKKIRHKEGVCRVDLYLPHVRQADGRTNERLRRRASEFYGSIDDVYITYTPVILRCYYSRQSVTELVIRQTPD